MTSAGPGAGPGAGQGAGPGAGPGAGGGSRARVRVVAGVVAGLVLVGLVVWLLAGRGGEDGGAGEPTDAATGAATGLPTTTASPTAPLPTKAPGQTEPTELATPVDRPAPVRVPLTGTAELPGALAVEVGAVERVRVEAQAPGETAGPAARVVVRVTNGSGEAIDLTTAVVNAYFGADRQPGTGMTGAGADPFAGAVEAGRSATGTYVFRLPEEGAREVTLELDLRAGDPVALFRGPF